MKVTWHEFFLYPWESRSCSHTANFSVNIQAQLQVVGLLFRDKTHWQGSLRRNAIVAQYHHQISQNCVGHKCRDSSSCPWTSGFPQLLPERISHQSSIRPRELKVSQSCYLLTFTFVISLHHFMNTHKSWKILSNIKYINHAIFQPPPRLRVSKLEL